ncbi:MAG: DNA-directed RNA polymerase subunit beta' [Spirochaetota bacterium]|nr:MAG: DNA-directed RNA polymerase subunit beta' [Spirochaetota bacterium]
MKSLMEFAKIKIKLASPELIRKWSYGEVKKPETINYRTLRPEREGLFCERIFGTTKEYECYCGKFKSIRYKGVVCDRCGVEVTHFKVRRERMGHIELAAPVSHIWFYRSVPSRMGLLLDLSMTELRSVLYFEKYIVIDPGDTDLKTMQLLTEEEYNEYRDRYGMSFTADIGADAIKTLLENLDLDILSAELREKMVEKGLKTDKRLLKRLEIVEDFRESGNSPEWMIMEVIPVIPPELRPMVQLDGGRFATSDLNDLYRRVINRNNRLKRLIALNAPEIIVRNEKRMLQEAVDALFDNSRKKRVVRGPGNRPLKSLSDMLKGKQGRFRQNLLGKRVDYSGRSVIVAGPTLKMHQCGLPSLMAMELFKPFIMKKLVDKGYVYNIKRAKTMVETRAPEVWSVLEEVVAEHPIMLNRAPTLHRMGIQAFEPILVEGKAIRLHPLVCHAFNADFDGDQMAVHVPLSLEAQIESWVLMLSSKNLLNPANGLPIVGPTQDMVLGIYYLTKEGLQSDSKKKLIFNSIEEVLMALENHVCSYNDKITLRYNGERLETTVGRVIFNSILPDEIEFINYTLGEKELNSLVSTCYDQNGAAVTTKMLDAIKDIGFKYATLFGITIGMEDIKIPEEKRQLIQRAEKEVAEVYEQYRNGLITNEERYNKVIDIWTSVNERIADVMMDKLKKDMQGFNPVYMMAYSGARGSKTQIRQLAGMRGLMAKPSGEIIELPIKSNFKEGLTVLEYFNSTHGARKGLADTALKTADAGYLTRRLIDIAQDVVITENDCGTINGIDTSALKKEDNIIESLYDRIVGRYAVDRIRDPRTKEIIIDANEEITEPIAIRIENTGIGTVKVRTVLTCESEHGVCVKCYGRNLAIKKTVDIGEAVGIIAAESIGQPGTQLTMRTFHIGGTAAKKTEENAIVLNYPVFIEKIDAKVIKRKDGKRVVPRRGVITVNRIHHQYALSDIELKIKEKDYLEPGMIIAKTKKDNLDIVAEERTHIMVKQKKLFILGDPYEIIMKIGSELMVSQGDIIMAKQPITKFDPFSESILTEHSGKVHLISIIPGTTMKKEVDEVTGVINKIILDFQDEQLQPKILIVDSEGNEVESYSIPGGAYITVEDNQAVKAGDVIAKIPRGQAKTKDITGGLPRVADLFEARKPKDAAVLAKVDGTVKFGAITKGKRLIIIEDKNGIEYKHLVPLGKHFSVRDSDLVRAGDPMCEGSINPHDILQIKGEHALQSYLVNEIQEVYRLQGVNINDKHIGVIVRQMLRKVEIVDVGDTNFIIGQQIDKFQFKGENQRVISLGGSPACAKPVLLGITRASLNIDSFISAASFQETSRVLTNAAIKGKEDGLRGLKENVIIGHLIPAGTGIKRYKEVDLYKEEPGDLELPKEIKEKVEGRGIITKEEVGGAVF